jgi:hypothetical protein
VIVGVSANCGRYRKIFLETDDGQVTVKDVEHINAYLVAGPNIIVHQLRQPASSILQMLFGNMPRDGSNFILSTEKRAVMLGEHPDLARFIRPYSGSEEMIQGKRRWCIWIEDKDVDFAQNHPGLIGILQRVRSFRIESDAPSTRDFAQRPHRFVQIAGTARDHSLAVAKVSSERRSYLPVELFSSKVIVSDLLFALYDAPLWNMALIASRIHLVWVATVCGKLETRYRYSNTLGWNTFPVPNLTEQNKASLTRCAENILLAREEHFPATIADLYDPDNMPEDLRRAHDENDEVLERIYIGRRFKNDTERLEKLFDLYTKMTATQPTTTKKGRKTA